MNRTIILESFRAIAAASLALAMGVRAQQPYAITTLSADDLVRSGATHLPDALRLTPGLDVARINANTWAISARGFNGQFANKLDVTIDGRSVYSPLFGGVYWAEIDLPLNDIDHVDIVRGPTSGGGMNGTVRIFTKHPRDTTGGRVSAWAGPGDGAGAQFRYGRLPNERLGLRLSLAHGDRQSFDAPNGGEAFDAWNDGRAGLRLDWTPDDANTLTLSANGFDMHTRNEVPGSVSQLLSAPGRQLLYGSGAASHSTSRGAGGTITWQHRLDDANLLLFRANAEHIARHTDSFDDDSARYGATIEYQTEVSAHQLHVGASYSYWDSDIDNKYFVSFWPEDRASQYSRVFAKDKIVLSPEFSLLLSGGIEHDPFTDWEWDAAIRASWRPNERHELWAGVSRSIRQVTRLEYEGRINARTFPFGIVSVEGGPDAGVERARVYEAGYRAKPSDSLSFDLSAFYNDYPQLRSIRQGFFRREGAPFPTGHNLFPFMYANDAQGASYGLEVSAEWRAQTWWRIRVGYGHLETDLELNGGVASMIALAAERQLLAKYRPGGIGRGLASRPRLEVPAAFNLRLGDSFDDITLRDEDAAPRHSAYLWNSWGLPRSVFLDAIVRYRDDLPAFGIKERVSFDARLAWKPNETFEFALIGRNLVGPSQVEFPNSDVPLVSPSEIGRSVRAEVAWKF